MITVIIQAGGASHRMGQDKALLPFLEKPLIQRVLDRVSPVADEILVTTNNPEAYQSLGLPLISDLLPGRGALGGVYTALHCASHPLAAILACDMPFVSPEILAIEKSYLLTGCADIAIPHSGEGLEPFHAVYRRETCLPAVESALQAGKWRVDSWFDQVKLHIIELGEILRYEPHMRCFINVNTPEELSEAERIAIAEAEDRFSATDTK
jgi:molybdopterin-guanine dinucleotide biosynthesis protein A